MKLKKAIPILWSENVTASISYFTNQLKFENKWEWNDEGNFGGVYMDDVEIFFCKEDQGSPCTWLSIVVDNVDEYYDKIKDGGAKIIQPPGTKEWNMREILVGCPDGHIIRFGHNTDCD